MKEQANSTAGSRPAKLPAAASSRAERVEMLSWRKGPRRPVIPRRALSASGPPTRPSRCMACWPISRAAGKNPRRYQLGSRSSSAAPWEKAAAPSHHIRSPAPAQKSSSVRKLALRVPRGVLRESRRAAGRTRAAVSHPTRKGPMQGRNSHRAARTTPAAASQNTTALINRSFPMKRPPFLPVLYAGIGKIKHLAFYGCCW